ncbi:unnamed protein product [Pieris brassicae]|uniref:Uncharacterized protein n=1 Tax=Pieris brassicae TaxID=7116 RepID=A0A9P0SWX8_PIEBR|nr:unnamed protein product [Pieris brassicae]
MHDTIVRLADVWKTCNKIRAAAFRVGLNLWDFYRPLDPEGNSLISASNRFLIEVLHCVCRVVFCPAILRSEQ